MTYWQTQLKKIAAKKLDLIVANDVSNHQIGFNSENNQVTFFCLQTVKKLRLLLKASVPSQMN